jgi:hypothetical protein
MYRLRYPGSSLFTYVTDNTSALLSDTTNYETARLYKTINLPVVLYGKETWSPTLREEYRLRSPRDINTGKWSSRLGVGRKAEGLAHVKKLCCEIQRSEKVTAYFARLYFKKGYFANDDDDIS